MKQALYYGWTPTGRRLHLGDSVLYQESSNVVRLDGFCGVIMRSWEDGSMPSPRRIEEFCRNCFRAAAWEAYVEEMGRRVKVEGEP